MKRYAFTMLELVFVIVIMGILGKFGVEFIAKAYKSFIFTSVNHSLQSNSAMAVEVIASRLQHRIKDSIIARRPSVVGPNNFDALADVNNTIASQYTVLEWISADIDGFRGDSAPYWSGIIDVDHISSSSTVLVSPKTDTTAINNLIQILSDDGNVGTPTTTITNAALYFIGSNSDITLDYGWSGNSAYLQDQNASMHPINEVAGNLDHFTPSPTGTSDFTDVVVSEYYKLAWTANAIVLSDDGNLTLHTDYQPWENNEGYLDATKKDLLMQNVDTFQFMAIGSIVKIQVCVNNDLVEDYSICKEKTIY